MSMGFPSVAFDDAVAAVCHGLASEEQIRALNIILRTNPAARDEYLLRVELHSRLASEPDLLAPVLPQPDRSGSSPRASDRCHVFPDGAAKMAGTWPLLEVTRGERRAPVARITTAGVALAACLAVVAAGVWRTWFKPPVNKIAATSAIAVLARAVDAQWSQPTQARAVGEALEPGWLRLKSGLAQVVFYSGARVVIEGPAELQLISPNEAFCPAGRLTAEVPPQARGFQVRTPQMTVTDLGTAFGLEVKDRQTELHVFKGSVELASSFDASRQNLPEGAGAVLERSLPLRLIAANPAAFASLFDLQARSMAAEALRYDQWRAASARMNDDPSLLVHLDFERGTSADWRLPNLGHATTVTDATLVGCQWINGRWPDKRALEFQSVSDRVRLNVPGAFDSLTLAAWVRVHGLDRKINSLFMCDGFAPGTIHWLIRNDGVLGLTVIGADPRKHQIAASAPMLTLDQFGLWLHLAVVLDGGARRVAHYVNGVSVSERTLKIAPPFHVGAAELGNWNAKGFPENDPFMIRNFSGAMDEFFLFGRALSGEEIGDLFASGKPQPDSLTLTDRRP